MAALAAEPTVFTQVGSDGVLVSPYIYRMTTLQTSLYPLTMKWLGAQKVKTASLKGPNAWLGGGHPGARGH
jgi:hypothetical protein